MKIKLDENVHGGVLEPLVSQGHDVATVLQQGLAGRPDADIAVRCLIRFFADNPEVSGHLWIVEDTRARDWTP